jgi:hypothetical protein
MHHEHCHHRQQPLVLVPLTWLPFCLLATRVGSCYCLVRDVCPVSVDQLTWLPAATDMLGFGTDLWFEVMQLADSAAMLVTGVPLRTRFTGETHD